MTGAAVPKLPQRSYHHSGGSRVGWASWRGGVSFLISEPSRDDTAEWVEERGEPLIRPQGGQQFMSSEAWKLQRDLCFCCRRHQVDKKDLPAPVSSSWMRTIEVNTGADSQVTHIYCRDVSQNRSEPRVIRNLTQANFTFFNRSCWWVRVQPGTCKVFCLSCCLSQYLSLVKTADKIFKNQSFFICRLTKAQEHQSLWS